VIGNNPGTHQAAYYLYTQDSSANTVVIWDAKSKRFSLSEWDAKSKRFSLSEWNKGSQMFKAKEGKITQIAKQNSHLQVFNAQPRGSGGSKLTPDKITEAILTLPREGKSC
jgi:hypothetical protein